MQSCAFIPNYIPQLPKLLIPKHIEELEPYKPGRPPEELMRELGIERLINLASNENPLGPPQSVKEAIANSLTDIHRYPEPQGLRLKEALAAQYHLGTENIAIGNGSESLLANIIRAFLQGDDEALTSAGTFIGFRVLIKSQGVTLKEVPLKNYAFDLDGIAQAINSKTKIIYLCNPNNPTGTAFNKDQFENFIKKVPHGILILLDEAYIEFCKQKEFFPDSQIYRFDNILTLRTFSKAYAMAGLRLGYALGHEHLISYINKIKLPFEPSCVAQAAGLAALADKEYMRRSMSNNRQGMLYLETEFKAMGLKVVPSEANFLLVDLDQEEKVAALNEALLRKGICIRPLKAFGLPHCFRVTVGLPEENQVLVEALKDLKQIN